MTAAHHSPAGQLGRLGPVVVLVGVPGSGKSTVGEALAAALGVGFRDTDADVEAEAGRSIADIFVDSGEAQFRRMEAAAVARALVEHPGVLALGGGAILDPDTRRALEGRPVVWLRVTLATAVKRAGLSAARPLLLGNVRSQMKALMLDREPYYRQVAAVIVDTDEHAVAETVADLVHSLALPALALPAAATGTIGTARGDTAAGNGSTGPASEDAAPWTR